uniref:Uncharacterized protein n=1 Tax=Romanomermis culicivorax TaxID=13658 RepID=A0A915I7X9_ROMCU
MECKIDVSYCKQDVVKNITEKYDVNHVTLGEIPRHVTIYDDNTKLGIGSTAGTTKILDETTTAN